MANEEAVNTSASAATSTDTSSVAKEDLEAKVAALEADKAKLIEETANWKLAALKAKGKLPTEELVETDEEKFRRIAREEANKVQIAKIDSEKEALLQKALKENKELKLAVANKGTSAPTAQGTHSESIAVQDTSITTEQLNAFKARGWTDKDIERYKKNLRKNSVR